MKKILLVEDDPFLIDIYNSKFLQAGFKVEIAETGDVVLSKMKEAKPDLVVLDLVLPHINGWGILKQIKEDPDLGKIPVVVFSNLSQKFDIDKAISMGVIKYLIKSQYTPSEVVEEIKKILN